MARFGIYSDQDDALGYRSTGGYRPSTASASASKSSTHSRSCSLTSDRTAIRLRSRHRWVSARKSCASIGNRHLFSLPLGKKQKLTASASDNDETGRLLDGLSPLGCQELCRPRPLQGLRPAAPGRLKGERADPKPTLPPQSPARGLGSAGNSLTRTRDRRFSLALQRGPFRLFLIAVALRHFQVDGAAPRAGGRGLPLESLRPL
jgi:hypothetical protein